MNIFDLIDTAIPPFVVVVMLISCYLFFIFLPIHVLDEAKCLELGYPKTNTTITLTSYCVKVDGDKGSVVMELNNGNS